VQYGNGRYALRVNVCVCVCVCVCVRACVCVCVCVCDCARDLRLHINIIPTCATTHSCIHVLCMGEECSSSMHVNGWVLVVGYARASRTVQHHASHATSHRNHSAPCISCHIPSQSLSTMHLMPHPIAIAQHHASHAKCQHHHNDCPCTWYFAYSATCICTVHTACTRAESNVTHESSHNDMIRQPRAASACT
jgi:hypothetical protein